MVFTSALAACGSDPAEDGAVATGGTAHHRGGEGGGDGGVSSGGVPPTGGADSVSSGGVSSTGGAPFGQGGDAPETSCSSGTFDHDEDTKTPCVAYRSCHAGQFVVVDATETTDRECQACAEGEFSTSMNAANCQPWRACSWSRGGVALPGSATTNVKCGVVSDYRQFGTAYADAARQVAVAEDGSVYVVGQRGDSEPANVDGFLRKYDSSGVEIWTRWTEAEDVFDVGIDASGNVYVAGTRLSESNRTGFIRRYDADGSLASQ